MKIIVNGEPRDIAAQTVEQLIAELGFAGQAVAVERNRQVVRKKDHAGTTIEPDDQLEVVTLVGGG